MAGFSVVPPPAALIVRQTLGLARCPSPHVHGISVLDRLGVTGCNWQVASLLNAVSLALLPQDSPPRWPAYQIYESGREIICRFSVRL